MEKAKICSVILAGGKGERLYPITATRPKPLCPVGGISCLSRCIQAAKKAGINDITVAACTLSQMIKEEAAKHDGVSVKVETKPLGTAGCVKSCAAPGKDALVLSGDGVNDFDLSALLDFHRQKGAPCTIAVTTASIPTEYGVITSKDGYVRRFYEKPPWAKVTSDTVNTGIYVLSPEALSYIPDGVFFDFSRDLFPLLTKKGHRIAAWEAKGYWCDIGNPEAYYLCALRYGDTTDPSARIATGANILSCVIMENAVVGEGAFVDSSILCEGAVIGAGAAVGKGCVIGGGAVIGERAALAPGILVMPGANIRKGSKIMKDVRFGGVKGRLFDGDEGIGGIYGETFALSDGITLGSALCDIAPAGKKPKIGVMCAPGARSRLLSESVSAGIRASGGSVYDLGAGFLSFCGFCVKEYLLDFTVFTEVKEDAEVRVFVFDADWLFVGSKVVKAIETSFFRGGQKAAEHPGDVHVPTGFHAPFYLYREALSARGPRLQDARFYIDAAGLPGKTLYDIARGLRARAFSDADKSVPPALPRFSLSQDGRRLHAVTEKGKDAGHYRLLCLYLAEKAKDKETMFVPEETPGALLSYLDALGCRAVVCGADDDTNRGKDFDPCYKDALFLCVSVMNILQGRKKSLDELLSSVPELFVRTITGEYDEDAKASKIRRLCAECGREDGARFFFEKGSVRFIPSSHRGFKIITEAASSEFAKELCDFALEKLKD